MGITPSSNELTWQRGTTQECQNKAKNVTSFGDKNDTSFDDKNVERVTYASKEALLWLKGQHTLSIMSSDKT